MEKPDANAYSAQVLYPAHRSVLQRLRADPDVEFIYHRDAQLANLRSLRPPPDPEVAEPVR